MYGLRVLLPLLLAITLAAAPVQKLAVEGTVTDGQFPISGFVIVSLDSGEEVANITVGGDGKYSVELDAGKDYLFNVVADRHEEKLLIVTIAPEGAISSIDSDGNTVDYHMVALTPIAATAQQTESYFRESAQPETRTFSRSASFSGALIRALPLGGIRNIDGLGLLAPGVAPAPATDAKAGPSFGPTMGTAGQYAVNGLRSRENNFTTDGSDNNDEEVGVRRQGFVSPFPQSPESIEEFQIVTAIPEAQFGHNISAQINVLSRYGESRFHGSLFGFGTASPLISRSFYNQNLSAYPAAFRDLVPITANGKLDGSSVHFTLGPSGHPLVRLRSGLEGPGFQVNPVRGKDSYTRFQGGFAGGGPISQKRGTFAFGSWERQIIHSSRQGHFSTPTVEQRGFYECDRSCDGRSAPMARSGPTQPDGDAVFSLYPFPNNPLGPYGPNTFTQIQPADALADLISAKVDQQFNFGPTSHILTTRGNASIEHSILPSTGGALFSSVKPKLRNYNFAMFFTSSLGSSLANTFRASFGRTSASFSEVRNPLLRPPSQFSDYSFLLNAPLLFNVTGANDSSFRYASLDTNVIQDRIPEWSRLAPAGPRLITSSDSITGPVGQITLAGFSGLGVDVFHLPQARSHKTIQFADSAAFTAGPQQLVFGFDARMRDLDSTIEKNVRPYFAFSNLRVPKDSQRELPLDILWSTQLAANGSPTGIFSTLAYDSDHVVTFRRNELDVFAQDKIQVTPSFHVSIGARLAFNQLPQQLNAKFKQAFDVDTLFKQAEAAKNACGTIYAGRPAALTTRCQLSLDILEDSFPADFGKTFGAERFRTDPRLGMVWVLPGGGRTVLRLGAGVYTGAFPTVLANESRDPFPAFISLQHPGNSNFENFGFGRLNDLRPALTVPGTLNLLSNAPLGLTALDLRTPDDSVKFAGILAQQDGVTLLTQPAPGLKNPFSRQAVVTLEHQLTSSASLSVAYVGTQGRRLVRVSTPQDGWLRSQARFWQALDQLILLPPQASVPSVITAYPRPVGAVQTVYESTARSDYHAMQTEMLLRLGKLQWKSSFTYSHAIDEVSDFFDMSGAYALPQNSMVRSERGSANFDVRHRMVNFFVWDLPFLQENAWGGWQIAGIYTLQSGQPFTVNTGIDNNLDGNLTDRPNTTNGLVAGDGPAKLIRTVPIASLLGQAGENGAVGRNTFRANGIHSLDVALTKKFKLKEANEVQLRLEAFNALNRTHFAVPVRILESPAFGRSVDTSISPRTIQVALKLSF